MEKDNLKTFSEQFENWILKDIKILLRLEDEEGNPLTPDRNTYDYHRPFVAAVILICCAIDVLAAFRYGRKKNDVGEAFKCFLRNYFVESNTKSKKSYNDQYIYSGLRNALLHGYSLTKDLALGHEDASKHLEKDGNYLIIDVFMFYYDLETVYFKYKDELAQGNFLTEFNTRWDFAPLIQHNTRENVKR